MPGTRRRPISRQAAPRITLAAVDLFERGVRLMRRRQTDEVYNQLNKISCELARELQFRPWNDCPLLECGGESPPDWMTGELAIADWWRSKGIRRELEAALRERRRAERAARAQRRGGGSSSPPPEPSPIAAAPSREG
jgi:hypothetical protein